MTNKAREKQLEGRFRDGIKERGGMSRKFHSPFDAGWPDRDAFMPGGKFYFAEFKTQGKSLTELQQAKKQFAEGLGFTVFVIDSADTLAAAFRALEIDQL